MEAGLQRALAAHGLGAAVAALERAGVMNRDSLSFVDDEVMQHLAQVERLPIVLCKMLRARLPAILQVAGPRDGPVGVNVAQTSVRGASVAECGRVGAAAVLIESAMASSAVSGVDAARVSAVDSLGACSSASGADAARKSAVDSMGACSSASGADSARVSAVDSMGACSSVSGADAARASAVDSLRASPVASGADAARKSAVDSLRAFSVASGADAANVSPSAVPMDKTRLSPVVSGGGAATSDGRLSFAAALGDSARISPAAPNADAATSGDRLSLMDSARHSPAAVVTESDSSCNDAATQAGTAAGTMSSVSTGAVLANAPTTTPTKINRGHQTRSPSTSPAFLAAGTAMDSDRLFGSKSQFFEELEPGSTSRPLNPYNSVRADYAVSMHATHKRGRGTSPSPTPKLPQLTRHAPGAPEMAASGSRRTFPFLLNFPALTPGADIIRVPALRPVVGNKKGKNTQVNLTRPMKKSLAQGRDAKGKFRSTRKKSSAKGPPPQSGENTRHAHTYIDTKYFRHGALIARQSELCAHTHTHRYTP